MSGDVPACSPPRLERLNELGLRSRISEYQKAESKGAGEERIAPSQWVDEAGGKALRRKDVRGPACAWVVWRRWICAEAHVPVARKSLCQRCDADSS